MSHEPTNHRNLSDFEPPRPLLPLPPPLRGNEYGTWAHSTITARLPEIARRVIAENELPATAETAIEQIIAEIPAGPIRPIQDGSTPDGNWWATAITPVAGRDWLSIPWFFAETYFYRRIVEAVDYFQSGIDPFRYQKTEGLQSGREQVRDLVRRLPSRRGGLNSNDNPEQEGERERLAQLLAVALWGNQADLSLWPAGEGTKTTKKQNNEMGGHLLVDDRPAVTAHLLSPQDAPQQIDILLDNAGYELVADLVLVDALLANPLMKVTAWVKIHPTFVSDATAGDVADTILALADDKDEEVANLGQRLQAVQETGRLHIASHPFWTSSRPGWEMPADLRADLAKAHLVIAKGDANYRRLLGDRHWSATASFPAILAYFPAPLLALRTVKAQLIAGLQPGQAEATRRQDPEWMENGRWGMIQFSA